MPVVLSRRVFDGIPNIPNDTFIAADDFSSAKELATFLKQLAANLTEYKRCVRKFSVKIFEKGFKKLNFPMENFEKEFKNFCRYFKWTKSFTHTSRGGSTGFTCQLCKLAHQRARRELTDFRKFWHEGGQCQDDFGRKASNLGQRNAYQSFIIVFFASISVGIYFLVICIRW